MTSVATFAVEVILKIAATFLRSIFVTVSAYFMMMGVSPFQADTSFQGRSLAKHSRIISMNGFGKTQILCPRLQPTHSYWMSSPTMSLPHSILWLMIAFTPLKKSFLLYALAKRRAFAHEHRRCVLRLIRRSNIEPKCGNNTFLVSPRSCIPVAKSL